MADKDTGAAVSPRVQAVIDSLREQGVAAGRARAEEIVKEAQQEADKILKKAEKDTKAKVDKARKEADSLKAAAEEAMRVAARDTVLQMKGQLMEAFSDSVRRLVAAEMDSKEMLRQMILEVCGRARADAGLRDEDAVEVLLPRDIVPLEELRRDPEELQEGALTKFVLSETGKMIGQGITLGAHEEGQGIKVIAHGGDVEVTLTDAAVAAVILSHLQPRFRALLEGIVR
jgi:V/A-type H+-transporting ATPase subunit E